MRLGVARATLVALRFHPAVLSPTRPRFLEEAAAKESDADGRNFAELLWPAAAREGPVLASAAMASISSSAPYRRDKEARALLD